MDITKYNLIRVYKSNLGNWKESKGDMQHTPTHIILSNEDFNALTNEICNLEDKVSRLDFELSKMESKHQEELRQANYDYSLELEKTQREATKYEQALHQAAALNINLKRICRERSNSDRGLKPKKEHSGFVCLSTSSYFERYKDGRDTVDFLAYKTVIQTPYDVSMDFDDVLCCIKEDKVFSDTHAKYGFNNNYQANKPKYKKENYIFRWNIRAVKSKKFWEIELCHTLPYPGEVFTDNCDVYDEL